MTRRPPTIAALWALLAALALVVAPLGGSAAHAECSNIISINCDDDTDDDQSTEREARTRRGSAATVARMLELVNDDRVELGLAPLRMRDDLNDIAGDHTISMARDEVLRHNQSLASPETKDRIGAARVGENVGRAATLRDLHRGFMASPDHRANIVDGRFTEIGIGVAYDDDGRVYATTDFVEPLGAAAPTSRTYAAAPLISASSDTPIPPAALETAAPEASPQPTVRVDDLASRSAGAELAAPLLDAGSATISAVSEAGRDPLRVLAIAGASIVAILMIGLIHRVLVMVDERWSSGQLA